MRKLFENEKYNYHSMITDDEIPEMSSITSKTTGIEDVVIWLGPNPHYHGYRIKISNIPNNFRGDNCFTLSIPDLKTLGKINSKLIDEKRLEEIKEFVKLNMKLIIKYTDREIFTDDLIEQLTRIEKNI